MQTGSKILFASNHWGPHLTIEPLEAGLRDQRICYLVEGVSKIRRREQGLPFLDMKKINDTWGSLEKFILDENIRAVVRSTSESVIEENVESLASKTAKIVGIPVFVIEDFPGNYQQNAHERLDCLFVEDESLIEFHSSRGINRGSIYNYGNPRYASLDLIDTAQNRQKARRHLGLSENERALLWAGQPDSTDSYLALTRLLPALDKTQVTLLFKAHPRDQFYVEGGYSELLGKRSASHRDIIDISEFSDTIRLYCASDLVVTQFSSAAVEASYLGVPALFVLFQDLGRKYLRQWKGYEELPWCSGGSAFLIEEPDQIDSTLQQALFDERSRKKVIKNFNDRFSAKSSGAKFITTLIQDLVTT